MLDSGYWILDVIVPFEILEGGPASSIEYPESSMEHDSI